MIEIRKKNPLYANVFKVKILINRMKNKYIMLIYQINKQKYLDLNIEIF